jgi:hypothetical protein
LKWPSRKGLPSSVSAAPSSANDRNSRIIMGSE